MHACMHTQVSAKSSQTHDVQELIEIAAPTLASAYALSRAVTIPVMCASGLTDVTAPLALSAGAQGVGIGSAVNKLPSRQQMLMAVASIASSIGLSAEEDGAAAVVDVHFSQSQSSVQNVLN